ncbi:uncharacterized protein Z520_11606 [Fonsecaea multimorphosa CBS 102226]|uniref:Major facilitator superfamily (MFS) profile domain-containing protein n=1 Tax=Fonsecaea multimorphosa CBS 102226 TaxID=1442371 RepID=A0A0D2JQJ2_9EURO|nr:uncharacterized protein Z520_11606 [Fonsecaea multimorphosa CBS 102226]KIX92754.1 hypothetical protein Z520_11606 [Fonsecaea multimorphosa CBS 102226]OAL17993.1 hypothetical protein AYO22_11149 [Fonsecaea multimorphosa]
MEQRHQLTPEHEAYLLERHGTTDLEPLPSADPNDPYNWPSWKKNANLTVVAFQGLTTVLNAAGVIPALPLLMEALGVSVHKATYIIGVNILFLGIAPLFWKPFANRFGRRPTWLLATLGSGLLNIGCVYSKSYGTMITFRILTACFLSPALGLGGAVVTETFFSHQRATKLGIWTVAFTIGPSLGPFLAGFIVYHTNNWQWVYWFFVIVSLATFVAALFLCPETLYIRNSPSAQQQLTIKKQYLSLRRIDPAPFTLTEIFQPYVMLLRPSVLLPAASYAVVFCFASPAVSVIIPTAYGEKFGLNAQQIGLQFLAIMIGAIIGEQVGGFLSDGMMRWKRGAAERRPAEFRLWASYIGFATAIAGMVEWGVTLQNAPVGWWTVKPDIGLGILTFGLQVVTTTLVTYAVDCNHNEAAAVGAAINQVRQIWSFIGPFWFVPMYEALGFAKAGGMMAGLIAAAALPILALHILASSRRRGSGVHFEHPDSKPEHQSVTTKDTGVSSYVEKVTEA